MKRFLLFMAAVLVAWPVIASAAPTVSPPASRYASSYTVVFVAGDTSDSQAIPVSGFCSVRYQQSSGDDASLYAVTTADTAASSGTLIGAFTASTTTATTFTAGTRWVKAVATDATAGGSVMTIDCAPLTGSGRNNQDADNDGEYEYTTLRDFDGDGSPGIVTCTAKDDPFPQCKFAGHRIYPDAMDDMNCAIHGCGYGKLERGGTLFLENVDYVLFGCWDVGAWMADSATPGAIPSDTSINDPRAAAITRRDDAADASIAACPTDSEDKPLYTLSLQDSQVKIIGTGTETANRQTSDGAYTQNATRLVVDMGPNDHGWYAEADGGSPGYRAVSVGFRNTIGTVTQHWTGSGALNAADSKGWGRIAGDYTVSDFRGDVCVCNSATDCDGNAGWASATDWTDDLVDGDRIFVSTAPESGVTKAVYMELRVLGDGPFDATKNETGTCPTGSVAVNTGGSVAGSTANTFFYGSQVVLESGDGFVAHPRSGYWDVGGGVFDLVITSQDFYDEAGGDCSGTGAWAFATAELSGDVDCDTGPLVGVWGAGTPMFQNVVITHPHAYAIDGSGHTGRSTIRDVTVAYGHGAQSFDPGNGWEMYDITLLQNHYADSALANFGHYQRWDGLRAYGNVGVTIQNLTETMGNTYRDFDIRGNSFSLGYFTLNCGSQRNTFENMRFGGNRRATAASAAFILRCAEDADPIAYNRFLNIEEEPPGMAVVSGSDPTTVVDGQTLFYFDHFSGSVWVEQAIKHNLFQGNRIFYDGGAGTDNSMFGVRSADGSEVLTTNSFIGNFVENGVLAGYCISTDCSRTGGGTYSETGAIFFGNMVDGAEYP